MTIYCNIGNDYCFVSLEDNFCMSGIIVVKYQKLLTVSQAFVWSFDLQGTQQVTLYGFFFCFFVRT